MSGTDLLIFVVAIALAIVIGFGTLFARNDPSLMSDDEFDEYIDEDDIELDDESDSESDDKRETV